MKKSTYRVIKSIGIFLFLLFFGVFIYFLIRQQNVEQKARAFSPESNPQDFEVLTDAVSQRRLIGFDYQRTIEKENSEG